MNKKIIGALIAVVIIAGAIGAAVVLYTPTPTEGEKVTVMMPYTPGIGWVGFYSAIDQGYYADEGLDVTIEYSLEGSMGPIKQVGANKIEFGYAGGDALVMARTKGIPVVMIYQVEHAWPYYIVSKKGSNITNLDDLVGKSVAVSAPGSPTYISVKAAMLRSGLDPDSANFVPVGGQLMTMLLEDKVDASSVHLLQKVLLIGMGADINVISTHIDFCPTGIVTSEKMIKENPEVIKKFLRATEKGYNYAIQHPEKAVDIFINMFPEQAEQKDTFLTFWKALISEVIQPDKYKLGSMLSFEKWTTMQDTLYDLGIIKEKIAVSEAFTDEFVPAAS
jgi:ABC-type nitrate/sulfonate/bicarbonate transport system substrate-binding protein